MLVGTIANPPQPTATIKWQKSFVVLLMKIIANGGLAAPQNPLYNPIACPYFANLRLLRSSGPAVNLISTCPVRLLAEINANLEGSMRWRGNYSEGDPAVYADGVGYFELYNPLIPGALDCGVDEEFELTLTNLSPNATYEVYAVEGPLAPSPRRAACYDQFQLTQASQTFTLGDGVMAIQMVETGEDPFNPDVEQYFDMLSIDFEGGTSALKPWNECLAEQTAREDVIMIGDDDGTLTVLYNLFQMYVTSTDLMNQVTVSSPSDNPLVVIGTIKPV